MKYIAIVGSRKYPNLPLVAATVTSMVEKLGAKNLTIVSGGARGVDKAAEEAADKLGAGKKVFPAAWRVTDEATGYQTYNPQAGFERNTLIIEAADAVMAFWDGVSGGTMDSVWKAKDLGKKVHVFDPEGKIVPEERWLKRR